VKVTYSSASGVPAAIVEERDACGVGFIASLKYGFCLVVLQFNTIFFKSQVSSHSIVKQALDACSCMEHRGATSADNISGDGAGIQNTLHK